jgi:hypothetical protein
MDVSHVIIGAARVVVVIASSAGDESICSRFVIPRSEFVLASVSCVWLTAPFLAQHVFYGNCEYQAQRAGAYRTRLVQSLWYRPGLAFYKEAFIPFKRDTPAVHPPLFCHRIQS